MQSQGSDKGQDSGTGLVGSIGHEIENDVVIQPLQGGQGLGQRGSSMSHPDAILRATVMRLVYLIFFTVLATNLLCNSKHLDMTL